MPTTLKLSTSLKLKSKNGVHEIGFSTSLKRASSGNGILPEMQYGTSRFEIDGTLVRCGAAIIARIHRPRPLSIALDVERHNNNNIREIAMISTSRSKLQGSMADCRLFSAITNQPGWDGCFI
eukprot:scaffold1874_cov134-Cylindrotheca_fusiformis.AAC.2